MTFGQRLRQLRLEGLLNQVELAKVFNVSKTAICNWEHDKRIPTRDKFIEIAKYFNVDLEYLLGVTNRKRTFLKETIACKEVPSIITDRADTVNTILENYLIESLLKYEKENGSLSKSDVLFLKNSLCISFEALKLAHKDKQKKQKS